MLAKPPPPSSPKRREMENGGRPRVRKEEGSHVCVVRGGAALPHLWPPEFARRAEERERNEIENRGKGSAARVEE